MDFDEDGYFQVCLRQTYVIMPFACDRASIDLYIKFNTKIKHVKLEARTRKHKSKLYI